MFSLLGSRRKKKSKNKISGSNIVKMFVPFGGVSACPETLLVGNLL